MTDLIIGGRGTGRSTELVKRSAATGVPILTATHNQRQYLLDLAKKMGLVIPKPLLPNDINDPTKFKGRRELELKGILVDDLNEVVSVLCHCPVNAVTWTDYGNITHLPDKPSKPTCRDLVKEQHPEDVDETMCGGVVGCPSHYGYLPMKKELCFHTLNTYDNNRCTRCWNQIAEEERS